MKNSKIIIMLVCSLYVSSPLVSEVVWFLPTEMLQSLDDGKRFGQIRSVGQAFLMHSGEKSADEVVTWEKNLDPDQVILASDAAFLKIDSLQVSDSGVYQPVFTSNSGIRRGQILELRIVAGAALSNQSVRARLSNLNAVLTLGFVLRPGDFTNNGAVLIRAVAPGLENFGVENVAELESLKLYNDSGNVLHSFDLASTADSEPELEKAGRDVGAFPLTKGDIGAVVNLESGVYTVQLRVREGSGGEVLLELYNLL